MVWWLAGCAQDPSAPPPGTPSSAPDTAGVGDSGHTATPDRPLAILSLNLHCLKQDGTPFATLEERLDAVATFAVGADVEALAVQEACVAGGVDALELLRARLSALDGVEWTAAWAFAHVGWEGTPDEAQEGVGLLARGELLDVVEVAYVSPGQLRRVALAARLPRGPVLVSTHLDYGDASQREDQARQTATWALAIADAVAASPGEVIVAGDLNDVAGSATARALGAMGFVDAARDLPADRIDHVFVHRGASWRPEAAALVLTDPPVSDHPGVLVHLGPAEPEPVVVTRLTAHVDVGFGHHLAVRGDSPPLTWERGWWAWPAAADRWELVLTELDGPFAFKTLVDDATWQAGPDVAGAAGAAVEVTPTF